MKRLFVLCLALSCACAPPPSVDDGGSGGGSAGGSAGGGTGGGGTGGGSAAAVTWYKDVLPVVQARCLSCHTTGGIGAFSMETFAAAQPQAAVMAMDTASRKMPPWMVDDGCGGPYLGSRHLSQAEIDVFAQWAQTGATEGNPADAPAAPDAGAGLSTVDLTLSSAQPHTPALGATDDYHCTILDPHLTADRDLVAYDIVPGVRAEVHHAVLYAVDRAEATALDTGGMGWTCFGGTNTQDQTMLGAWAPGSTAVHYPLGTGLQLAASKVIVMQVHYNTQNGVRSPDNTQVKLQFASGPVTRASLDLLVDFNFAVPPNAIGYTHSKTFSASPNTQVWGIFGHQHTQGAQVHVTAGTQCLLDIPHWDFQWQQQYFYQSPIQLGSQPITLSCTWNNTTNRQLTFGENTSDEMCVAALYTTPN